MLSVRNDVVRRMRFFLDFDGTISTQDVVDVVLERFADKRWKEVEKEWAGGLIGSRECLSRQIAMIRATPEEIDSVLSSVKLDPYFVPFLKKARQWSIPVAIVSDGFDLFIERVLKQNLGEETGVLKGIPVFSNKLKKTAAGFQPFFTAETPCEHGCANCKEALIRKMSSPDAEIFFAGDGFSDRFAARAAHLTFAKGKLLTYCRENGIPHVAYENFKKIEETMAQNHALLRKVPDGR